MDDLKLQTLEDDAELISEDFVLKESKIVPEDVVICEMISIKQERVRSIKN